MLDAYSARLLGVVHGNPAAPARVWPSVRTLPPTAERAVRLAWVRAYLDTLGLTGEVHEVRWKQALKAKGRDAFARVWTQPASPDESEDALVEVRSVFDVEDPQTLGAGLSVDWRRVTEDTLRRWWDASEDALELIRYAAPRISRQALVLLATACARTALRYIPEGEERPLRAIEIAEAWARGEATQAQVRTAVYAVAGAASATAALASPTNAAFGAVSHAVTTASYAASSAAAASDSAASAVADSAVAASSTDFSGGATWGRARRNAFRALAEFIRSKQSFPGW